MTASVKRDSIFEAKRVVLKGRDSNGSDVCGKPALLDGLVTFRIARRAEDEHSEER